MKRRSVAVVAWAMAALVILISGFLVFHGFRNEELPGGLVGFALDSMDLLIAPVFAVVGAVIVPISRGTSLDGCSRSPRLATL